MAQRRVPSIHDLPAARQDDGDSISLESITSDDPERNRLLDFYSSDDRVHTPRSVSTQSSQYEDDEWVLVDRPKKESSTQTNVHLTSSQDMLRKISRAQLQELRQVRGQTCCASHGAAKARYELVVKTQRLEMIKKMDMLQTELKEQTMENNRKTMENNRLQEEISELKEQLQKLQVQVDYFKEITTPMDASRDVLSPPTTQLSSTLDDPPADVSDQAPFPDNYALESGARKLVCSRLNCFLHLIPVSGELVTMGSRGSFPCRGVGDMETVTEENLCIV